MEEEEKGMKKMRMTQRKNAEETIKSYEPARGCKNIREKSAGLLAALDCSNLSQCWLSAG